VALPGEPPSLTAKRELQEETTLDLPEGALSGVYYEAVHRFGPMIHFVFRPRWDGQQDPVAIPPEIGDVGWFELDALPAPMSDFTERRIRDALNEQVDYAVVSARVWRE